jgi:hypothetical protein
MPVLSHSSGDAGWPRRRKDRGNLSTLKTSLELGAWKTRLPD